MPAIVSPLLLLPEPPIHVSHQLADALVIVCGSPRAWALVATVVAIVGARKFSRSWVTDGLAAAICVWAWIAASSFTAGVSRLF